MPEETPEPDGYGGAGLLASLLAAVAFAVWCATNGAELNALTIGLVTGLLALVLVNVALIKTDAAWAKLSALGLWIFLGVSVSGLAAAAAATQNQLLVVSPITIRMVLTGAVVALYAVALFGVRYRWIIQPMAQNALGFGMFPQNPRPQDFVAAAPSLFADGYFLRERQKAETQWINSLKKPGCDAEWDLVRAYVAAAEGGGLKISMDALVKALADPKDADAAATRRHALVVALNVPNRGAAKSIFLIKVQNQLCIFTLILLGAVAVFSALGWAAPMGVAAAAAIIFRLRDLTPVGKSPYDGGARWMALFMTPLTGAVSAVLGLTVVSALAGADVLSDTLETKLGEIPGIVLDTGTPAFEPLLLGLAIAFGWSARLLDDMLKTLTSTVQKQDDGASPQLIEPSTAETRTDVRSETTADGSSTNVDAKGTADSLRTKLKWSWSWKPKRFRNQ